MHRKSITFAKSHRMDEVWKGILEIISVQD